MHQNGLLPSKLWLALKLIGSQQISVLMSVQHLVSSSDVLLQSLHVTVKQGELGTIVCSSRHYACGSRMPGELCKF